MAKQFTTAALLILEAEGKLDFKRPVQAYLPAFPEYAWPITLQHLVHHTSGIRETNSMQLFQGIDPQFEEVFDTDDLVELVLQQKELNFAPGSEYRYSSGGYAVLAKIVEKVSGKPFPEFVEERIFRKLGMYDTRVSDDHNEIIPNRAVSYWPQGEGQWERRSQVFDAYGDGGIITTVRDLLEWDKAFYEDRLGVENFAEKMYQKGRLNSGEEIEYARALQIREFRGQRYITHNGGMLGFRVDMIRFPDKKLFKLIFCRRKGPVLGSDEINKERIAALWARNLMKSGSRISILKWPFAAHTIKFKQFLSIIALANAAYANPTREILNIAGFFIPEKP